MAFIFVACGGDAPDNSKSPADLPSDPVTSLGADDSSGAAAADGTSQIGPASEGATLATDPLIFISPREIRQGESFVVAVDAPGAGFASVAFNGQILSLLREGSRFFTILGVDALTPPGPLPLIVSVADSVGRPVVQRESLVTVTDAQWQIEVIELDESNSDLLDPLIIAEDAAIRFPVQQVETPERHWNDIFDPPSTGVITSSYGFLRSYNQRAPEEYHSGLDFGAENGAPVLAPNAGVIAWVGQTRRRGNGVLIDHGGGVFSGHYHMSEVFAEVGQVINAGEFLGRVGATGLATGPHLHWEIVVHGVTVDPVQWIRLLNFPDPLAEFDVSQAIQGPNQLDR
ncbi:MAG TPA: M23 family metallopeptidase [Dehalococcoidia bacterium]|nr:M23 family metallopeptidase [Dehalococcoidia bacterium]